MTKLSEDFKFATVFTTYLLISAASFLPMLLYSPDKPNDLDKKSIGSAESMRGNSTHNEAQIYSQPVSFGNFNDKPDSRVK